MLRKLLLSLSFLTIAFILQTEAQTVNLKNGELNLELLQPNQFLEANKQAVWNGRFYGLAHRKKSSRLPEQQVVYWLNPEVALVHLGLNEASSEIDYYNLPPIWKIDPYLSDSIGSFGERIEVTINLYHYNNAIQETLESYGTLSTYNHLNRSINIELSTESFSQLLQLAFVYWVELPAPSLETHNLRERTNHRVPLLNTVNGPYQLTGKGVVMGEWDGGGADDHIDYQYRHTRIDRFVNNNNGRHATHVAGTMLGAGIKDPNAMGMAPEATFYSYDFFGSVTTEMDTAARKYGIEFTQNSYGYNSSSDNCTRRGTYDNTSVALDRLTNKYPNLLHVYSAGNSRSSNCRPGGYGTVGSGYQSSKNSLAVGAVRFTDANSWFSSYGPVRDGRLKPEITAVGVDVYSTFPNNTYRGGYNGTSMSCPGTSGTAALITQLYKELQDTVPPAHLIKGVLCNAADDLGRSGPDYQYGFGRLNGYVAANIVNDSNYRVGALRQNGVFTDTIFVQSPHLFKVMMCYSDVEASTSASKTLVNDLDLLLIDDAGDTIRPWTLNPNSPTATATRGTDNLNNIEQVTISSPTSRYYIYQVRGTQIPSGSEEFSMNWLQQDTALRVVYPNGGEKWLPPSNSSRRQIIRWDAPGLSGNARLSYSTNKGASWNVISSSVNLNTGYFIWQNCPSTVATAEALIKIEQGTWADSSDAVFDIFQTGPTPSAIACSKQLHITWNPISNATSYNVYRNDSGLMKLMGTTSNTSFTLRGLNDTQSYWVAVSAIAANGAEGPRSTAVEFETNSSITPPYFTRNPRNTLTCSGSAFGFNAVTAGSATLTRKWQVSTDSGMTWKDIPNSDTDFILLPAVYTSSDSNLYRITATNVCQSTEASPPALLQVDTVLPYSYPERNINVCIGEDTALHLVQNGNSRSTISWYFTPNGAGATRFLMGGDSVFRLNLNDIQTSDKGTYYVQLSNGCGTQNNGTSIELDVNDPLQLSIVGDDRICFGQTSMNTAIARGGRSDNYTIFWQMNSLVESGTELNRMQDSTETWTVGVFDFCSEDTVYVDKTIHVRSLPEINLPADTTICKGVTIDLIAVASGGNPDSYHYLWSDGLPDKAIVSVNPPVTTTYQLILTDSCSAPRDTARITVSVLKELNVEILASSDTTCFGQQQTLTLKASGGDPDQYSFAWDDGSTSSSRTIQAFADSMFYVELTDGCTPLAARDTFDFTARALLQVSIVGKDTLCLGEIGSYTADASGGLSRAYTFDWNSASSNSIQFKGVSDTTLTLRLTDGCTPQPAFVQKQIFIRSPLELEPLSDIRTCKDYEATIRLKPSGGRSSTYTYLVNGQQQSSSEHTNTYTDSTQLIVQLSDNCSEQDAFDTLWIDIRPINPVILNVMQENLLVKAQTIDDGNENWWGPNTSDLTQSEDNSFEWTYSNYGPAQLCLQKIDDANCADTNCIALDLFDVYETQGFDIKIYPNPASTNVHIELDKIAGSVNINLLSYDGKYIWQERFSTFSQTLYTFDVSHLASSVYIVEIETNGEVIREKIFVN